MNKKQFLYLGLLFILLLSLTGCGEEMMAYSNELHMEFQKEVWDNMAIDTMPPIVIPKEVQFIEYTAIEAADLVIVIDFSPVEVHFYPYEENVYPQTRGAVIDTIYKIIVTDAYGNETIVKVQPDVIMNPGREGIPEERIYDLSTWVPSRDIACVDSKVSEAEKCNGECPIEAMPYWIKIWNMNAR